MKEIKRLEVVIDAVNVPAVEEVLRKAGVDGYTVIRGASGWGDRGSRRPDGVSGVFENCVVLCACDPGLVDAVGDALRPVLKRYGGVALVSDAQRI
ncbi:MAG: transcriptional regulator [Planctomycetota bacterium]